MRYCVSKKTNIESGLSVVQVLAFWISFYCHLLESANQNAIFDSDENVTYLFNKKGSYSGSMNVGTCTSILEKCFSEFCESATCFLSGNKIRKFS